MAPSSNASPATPVDLQTAITRLFHDIYTCIGGKSNLGHCLASVLSYQTCPVFCILTTNIGICPVAQIKHHVITADTFLNAALSNAIP